MRILQIITKSERGGAQTVVASLASELAQRGHTVAIASGREGNNEAWQNLASNIEWVSLQKMQRAISPLRDLQAVAELTQLYKKWQPDIVHLHTSKAAALGRMASGIDYKKIVYTMHGYFQVHDLHKKFLLIDKCLRNRCGAIVAVSRADEKAMTRDAYTVHYIANGVAPAQPQQVTQLSARLENIKASGKPLALMIARRAGFKRIDLVREAARNLQDALNIAWLGGEPQSDDPSNFFALGNVAAANGYLHFADIYVQASEHEGNSMAILEAMSAGLPCVVSNVGGNSEVLNSGEFGFVIENSVNNFVTALAKLARDKEVRLHYGQAARARWETEYSLTKMVSEYEKLYVSLQSDQKKK